MAENKKSFIAYSDWKDTFDVLADDKAGQLIKHIFAYVNDENPESNDTLIEAVFISIRNTLKRDLSKWDTQREQRVAAGKKSAEVRKRNATTVNDRSNSSTVSVSGSVSVNVKEREASFKNDLLAFKFKYPTKLLKDFLLYWTEKSPQGRKMRFEKEKVFDISRRLKTWSDREPSFKSSKKPDRI